MNSKLERLVVTVTVVMGFVAAPGATAQEVPVKNGEKIAFFGDTFTLYGQQKPSGFVNLVISGLKGNSITALAIPAGMGGNNSNQLLDRLERDVISKKPNWLALSCGVYGMFMTPLDSYKKNMSTIVDTCQAAGIHVMLLTSFYEDPKHSANDKMTVYNEFLRGLARKNNCLLADISADMLAAISNAPSGHTGLMLMADASEKMNPSGYMLIATCILRGFGLNEAQIQKAQAAWLEIPAACCEGSSKLRFTVRQWRQLEAEAAQKKTTVPDLVNAKLAALAESFAAQQR